MRGSLACHTHRPGTTPCTHRGAAGASPFNLSLISKEHMSASLRPKQTKPLTDSKAQRHLLCLSQRQEAGDNKGRAPATELHSCLHTWERRFVPWELVDERTFCYSEFTWHLLHHGTSRNLSSVITVISLDFSLFPLNTVPTQN